MPKIASTVNKMSRKYLIVYDDDVSMVGPVEGEQRRVMALSPSIVRHGAYCAVKYGIEIPENLTYQQQQQQLVDTQAKLHVKYIECNDLIVKSQNQASDLRDALDLIREKNTELENMALELSEMTRQRDAFSRSLKRTTEHLWKVKESLATLSFWRRLKLLVIGYQRYLSQFQYDVDRRQQHEEV